MVLNKYDLIHGDLNPENILVQFNHDKTKLEDIRVIDFGCSVHLKELWQITTVTPEYTAPEVLRFLHFKARPDYMFGLTAEELVNNSEAWSLDVWSLGTILLELVSGFPVWMDLSGRLEIKGCKKVKLGRGQFAVYKRKLDMVIAA